MGANVYVYGIRNPGGKLSDMVDLALMCDKNNIAYPSEVVEYFKGTDALDQATRQAMLQAAVEVDLKYDLKILKGDIEYGSGATIQVSEIPKDIQTIKICMG